MVQFDVVVIDTNNLFRAGLVSLLSTMGFARVDEARSVADLIRMPREAPPQIVLSDLPEGLSAAINTIRQIGTWAPDTKVIFLADDIDLEILSGCYAAGASGFLLKSISRDALAQSLRLVSAGEKVFPSRLASFLSGLATRIGDPQSSATMMEASNLSDREIAILRCLVNGQSNKVIAANLDIAESTVKVHLKSILRKIGARNRTQAAIWAIDRCRAAPTTPAAPVPARALSPVAQ